MARQILKRILFTSVGRRVELVRAFQEASVREQIPVWIIGADLSDSAPALFFCDEAVKVCRICDADYISQLLKICREKCVELLIPTIDTDLYKLAEARKAFEEIGTKVLISAPDMIRICRDKRLTAAFFHDCGLYSPDPVDKVEAFAGPYPCFIKPLDGSSSVDAYKVGCIEDLKACAHRIGEGGYIIQPFISGREYTIDIFCDFGGAPVFITPRERLAVRSGEVQKTRIVQDERMLREAHSIIERFHPVGTITVQLIREQESGRDYFIEINPRFGGGAPLSIRAGADIPAAILHMLTEEKRFFQQGTASDGAVYARFDESICLTDRQRTIPAVKSGKEAAAFVKELVCKGAVDAVVFDLDDTLYPEYDYVKSGFRFAAAELAALLEKNVPENETGIPIRQRPEAVCRRTEEDWYDYLIAVYHADGKPIDAALEESGLTDEASKKRILQAYRYQQPELNLYPWADELIAWLTGEGGLTKNHIGIITDGRPEGQHAKLLALNLAERVGEIVITDELGGPQFRKPCDVAFRIIQLRMGLPMERILYVGNNPAKDLKAPRALGMKTMLFDNPQCIHTFSREARSAEHII